MIQTPEDNTFTRQPEFITRDHRQYRPIAYPVTSELMYKRHRIMLPPELINGKTVLDIGSCYGATGAWCLDNGAKHYTGLEPQRKFVEDSRNILGMYYKPERYEVIEDTIESFAPSQKYDVVVACGVIYGVFDPYKFVEQMTQLATESVVIETEHPFYAGKLLWRSPTPEYIRERLRNIGIIETTNDRPTMIDANSESNFSYNGVHVSVQALTDLFRRHGWSFDGTSYDRAEQEIPKYYDPGLWSDLSRRYMARFYPSGVTSLTFEEVYKDPGAKKTSWTDIVASIPWNKK